MKRQLSSAELMEDSQKRKEKKAHKAIQTGQIAWSLKFESFLRLIILFESWEM